MTPPFSRMERRVQLVLVFSGAAQAKSTQPITSGRLNIIEFKGIIIFIMKGSGTPEGS
jgi:hypothetical protein